MQKRKLTLKSDIEDIKITIYFIFVLFFQVGRYFFILFFFDLPVVKIL
jgi:hypothetical protein